MTSDEQDQQMQAQQTIAELRAERDEAEKQYLAAAFNHLTGGDPKVMDAMVNDMDAMQQRAETAERERSLWLERYNSLRADMQGFVESLEQAQQTIAALTAERDELREDADIDRLTFGTAEDAAKRAEQAEREVATLKAERQAGADLFGEIIEKAMHWQDRAEQAEAREKGR
jgi:HPt (histidine-containing phosphotransfer) domain-containing protein